MGATFTSAPDERPLNRVMPDALSPMAALLALVLARQGIAVTLLQAAPVAPSLFSRFYAQRPAAMPPGRREDARMTYTPYL
jgi:hypothetical protein